MTDIRLNDRWQRIEYPVLLEAARQVEDRADVSIRAMATAANTDEQDVELALQRLERAGYLTTQRGARRASGEASLWGVELEERGLRATGLWPDEDQAADALVQLLEQAAGGRRR